MFWNRKNSSEQIDIITPEGFEKVYVLCFDKMFELAFYQIKSEEKARELIQEFFTSIWEKRKELSKKEKIEFYLLRLFKYRIIDYLRAESTRNRYVGDASMDRCYSSNCTEEQVFYKDLKNSVDHLVDRLSYQCKKVFLLHHEKGMTNKEIASILLISESAVAHHLARARHILKEKISLLNSA